MRAIPDLGLIQKNNAGGFPFARVYDIIDGRESLAAHASSDMPAWGRVYWNEAGGATAGIAMETELEAFTRGRLIALIVHIYGLQAK